MHVEEVWSPSEEKVVKALYERLAKNFGITLINHHLTLRFEEGSVNMVIHGVSEKMFTDTCHLCGSKEGLKPAACEITHANGDTHSFKTFTCVDCRCPQ